MDMTFL